MPWTPTASSASLPCPAADRRRRVRIAHLSEDSALRARYTESTWLWECGGGGQRVSIWIQFALGLAGVVLLTPCARRVAAWAGVVDVPSARKVHVTPTPLLGGVAIYLAIVFSVACSCRIWPELWTPPLQHVLLVVTGLLLVGVFDDCLSLYWLFKLGVQVVAAWLLYRAGIRVQLAWLPGWANLALTLGWLVGITNAVNFLDNMNGLAAGLCTIAAAFFAILGFFHGTLPVAGIAAAVAGACLGFLRFNYRRASIFMGDAGSLVLGLLLAALGLMLRFPSNRNWVTWMVPVCVMAVPVFDTTMVCVSRLRHGRNPFATPGKDHVSHRLVLLGLSREQAVDRIYLAAIACGMVGLVVSWCGVLLAYLLGTVLFLTLFGMLVGVLVRVPVRYPPKQGLPDENPVAGASGANPARVLDELAALRQRVRSSQGEGRRLVPGLSGGGPRRRHRSVHPRF